MKIIDLPQGGVFGRWTVLAESHRDKHGYINWLCRCECGTEKTVCSHELRSGRSKSCGCLASELKAKRMTTHGHTKRVSGVYATPTYRAWVEMIRRCTKHGRNNSYLYVDRGIRVCDRWAESFDNFLEDMGERPDGMSLDRIDNDAGYEPANCRWADKKTQSRNRRGLRMISYNGATRCLSEWAEILGFKYHLLKDRLSYGWDVDRAFTTPVGVSK